PEGARIGVREGALARVAEAQSTGDAGAGDRRVDSGEGERQRFARCAAARGGGREGRLRVRGEGGDRLLLEAARRTAEAAGAGRAARPAGARRSTAARCSL